MARAIVRTLYWFQDDDYNNPQIASQDVSLNGPGPLDDFVQGEWAINAIGPFYVSPGGTQAPQPHAQFLKGPIGAIGQGIPWWWILGQQVPPPPPLPATPTITKPSSGATKPYWY